MPVPWNNPGSSDLPVESKGFTTRTVTPPQWSSVLDCSNLNGRKYTYEARKTARELPQITSGKKDSDELDSFCAENTLVVAKGGKVVSDTYGVARDVRDAVSDERIVQNLARAHVTKLNAVQQKSLQVIRDEIGCLVEAPTGIGKTYAFLIPSIERCLKERREQKMRREKPPEKPSPFVLIMAPTGPLAQQLFSRCELILGLRSNAEAAIHDIKIDMLTAQHSFTKGECDIAFCTMGKLKASIESGEVLLDQLKMIVLDEADKMIDSTAFGCDIKWVLSKLSERAMNNLQSCFFSATYVRDMDNEIALNQLQCDMLGERPWKFVYCPRQPGYIKQSIIKLPRTNNLFTSFWLAKMNAITTLIDKDLEATGCTKEGPYNETIAIFCETVGRVAQVSTALRLMGYNFKPVCRTVYKQQQAITLNDLEFKKIHGVVCTNVVARGVDISSVKHSIIMEMGNEFNTYKHRIGRVGRDGTGGKSTIIIEEKELMNPQFCQIMDELYEFMEENRDAPEWFKEWHRNRYPDGYQ